MADEHGQKQTFAIRSDILTAHKDYEFFRRSYEGGSEYREGNYLIRHVREKKEDYDRRKEQASFANFCSDVVDIYNSYLYREQPERKFPTITIALEDFLNNADFQDRPWPKVARHFSKMSGYYGIMGALIDKPKGSVETEVSKAAEIANGIRPYIVPYSPLAIWDWTYSKDEQGRMHLSELILEEENDDPSLKHNIMQWTPAEWILWGNKDGEGWSIIDQGENRLGEIPFALLRNRDSFKKFAGVSDIADIADVNRRIYYLDSDALEIIENTAFPILEGAADAIDGEDGKDQEKIIGTTGLLKRGEGGVSESGFRWIEAPHTSLGQILEHRRSSIEDLKAMAKTGQGEAEKTQTESGIALELRFQQLTALLADKAENAEAWEKRIFDLVGKYESIDYKAEIKYPRKFGIRDLMHDLDVAINSKMVISSPTYAKEIGKSFAARILPRDTDKDIMKTIDDEIDNPVEPIPGSEDEGDDE